jgi:hypothetical protein
LDQMNKLFGQNQHFRQDVIETTQKSVKSSDEAALAIGKNFILEELAMMQSYPTIMNFDQVVFIYHKEQPPVFINTLNGYYDSKQKSYKTSFAVVQPSNFL